MAEARVYVKPKDEDSKRDEPIVGKKPNIREVRVLNGDKVIEFVKTLTQDSKEVTKIIGNAYVRSKPKKS